MSTYSESDFEGNDLEQKQSLHELTKIVDCLSKDNVRTLYFHMLTSPTAWTSVNILDTPFKTAMLHIS